MIIKKLPLLNTLLAIVLLLGFSASLAQARQSQAGATIQVNTNTDVIANDGLCSLREAVIAANSGQRSGARQGECSAGSGETTILLDPVVYQLTRTAAGKEDASQTGDLDIASNINLLVVGEGQATIQGVNFNNRIIQVHSGTVIVSNINITGGNSLDSGGGMGGGVANHGNLTLRNSYIYQNSASGQGGGIYNAPGAVLSLDSTTLAANSAVANGGGLANEGTAFLINSTVSGNTSQASGGGIYNRAEASLNAVTITGNQAGSMGNGGGIAAPAGGTFNIKTSVVAGNGSAAAEPHLDCSGSLNSFGNNLLGSEAGCILVGGASGDLTGLDPILDLQLSGENDPTPTHALLAGSPALNAGSCTTIGGEMIESDQRGVTRPQGPACDIGAYERLDPLQNGPIFTVNNVFDIDSAACSISNCSLRSAILAANARPNDTEPDRIHFNLPGTGLQTIDLDAPLPAISDPLVIDGYTQPGASRSTLEQGSDAVLLVALNGSDAGPGASGLSIDASASTIEGLIVYSFGGDGIAVRGDSNVLAGNSIHGNGGAGVNLLSGSGNTLSANSIYENSRGGILLAAGANNDQAPPDLTVAATRIADAVPSTDAGGVLTGLPDTTYRVEVFSSLTCQAAQGRTFHGYSEVQTGGSGQAEFVINFSPGLPLGTGLTTTATGPDGSTSSFSNCLALEALNDSWLTARSLSASASARQVLYQDGQSGWYKFPVAPGGRLVVKVSGSQGGFVTLHRDLLQTYTQLEAPISAAALAASELPGGYLPGGYLPGEFLPGGYLPGGYLPGGYLPGGYLPGGYLPGGYLPGGYLPGGYLPGGYLPGGYLPGGYLPADFLPGGYLPGGYLPELYSGAIRRSLMAISYDLGDGQHLIERNTFDLDEELYVQVTGAAALDGSFQLEVIQEGGICSDLPRLPAPGSGSPIISGPQPGNAGLETLIVWDSGRMTSGSSQEEIETLRNRLSQFAGRSEIRGTVIDLADGSYPRVAQANEIADANAACYAAKNGVAAEIKRVIDIYRAANSVTGGTSLKYLVLVGSDNEIPFYRYPDQAGLANENEYIPPVAFESASEASLRSGQVLGQDEYGSVYEITRSGYTFPVPQLAVGRLVRTATQIVTQLEAYTATDGVVSPQSALVTGYDFVADAASAIRDQFEQGLNPANCASQPGGCREVEFLFQPQDAGLEGAWNATQLREKLLPASGQASDLIFFAGHFSAGGVLAADYTTSLYTPEVAESAVDFTNSLIFALGCHSGYNVPGSDALPFSPVPDWAETYAGHGATYIAATGYAYGDTELIEYGERLFLELSRRLRTGSGTVTLGPALVDSKLDYLTKRVALEGLDDKTLLTTSLYGLPMIRVNLPGERLDPGIPPGVGSPDPVTGGPGASYGLSTTLVQVSPSLTRHDVPLTDIFDNNTLLASYFSGTNGGVIARPAEPIFPLERVNASAPGMILRGIGLRGGSYSDQAGITPLTSAATTETSRSHPGFFSDSFYPLQNWGANYIASLENGPDWLLVTAAQYRSSSLDSRQGIMRTYNNLNFRLYYLDKEWPSGSNSLLTAAGVAASPNIRTITLEQPSPDSLRFLVRVESDPAAGVQDVWVTFTSDSGAWHGMWQSLDLARDGGDPSLWAGSLTLPGGVSSADLRYFVQAANGTGLVSLVDPSLQTAEGTATNLEFVSVPASPAPYNSPLSIQVRLTSSGSPLAGKVVQVSLSGQARLAATNSNGVATVRLPALALPGDHQLHATFLGSDGYRGSSVRQSYAVSRQSTKILLDPPVATGFQGEDNLVTATLLDILDQPIREKALLFTLKDSDGTSVYFQPAITNYLGQAFLAPLSLPPGDYGFTVFYGIFLDEEGQQADFSYDTYFPSTASGTLTLLPPNNPPVCSTAVPIPSMWIWPPNNNVFYPFQISGVFDPDEDPIAITIDGIYQDEPVEEGGFAPDAHGLGTDTAHLRAERLGNRNGRVYHIFFTATDGKGGSCSVDMNSEVKVRVGVSANQGQGIDPIDEGPLYDSTVGQ